jgi:signal transduction histidine kinase
MSSASPPKAPRDPGQHAHEVARLRLARMGVAGASGLGEFWNRTTELAAETLAVERVGVWLYVDERRAIRCFHLFERSKGQHSEGAILRAADFPIYFRALEEHREVAAADARGDALTRELGAAYLEPLGIGSMLDAPILRDGGVVGVVCHEHVGPPRSWTPGDRTFAASVADQVARAFEEAARRDAEERVRELEAYALEGQKMEAIARLAAGAAHDFNNLLTVMISSADAIARDPTTPARQQEAARRGLEAARRGADLARELLALGRDARCAPCVVDVAAALSKMEVLLRAAAGPEHGLAIRCEGAPGRVLVDPAQLERVVLNLVLNARDAMPDGGPIEVVVSEARVEDGDDEPGAYVVIEVADSGIGMDAATRARIFEPFFTTKPKGRGSGVGLSVVYGVVERAGGFVHVDSTPGRGTRMRMYLPRVAAA